MHDVARLERAVGAPDEDEIAAPGREDGRARDVEHRQITDRRDPHRRVHPRLQFAVRIVQGDPQAHRAGLGAHGGLQEHHATPPCGARACFELDLHCLSDPHQRKVPLEHLALHPHHREIGDAVEWIAGHDPLPLEDDLLGDHAGVGCADQERTRDLTGPLNAFHLGLRHVPVEQSLASGLQHLLCAASLGLVGGGHVAHELGGEHEFLLGTREHRRIGREQGLSGAHLHSGEIHLEPVHPAVELQAHRAHTRLVERDLRDRAHLLAEYTALHRRVGHTDASRLLGVEHHGLPGITTGGGIVQMLGSVHGGARVT